jgi:hypothetical protein
MADETLPGGPGEPEAPPAAAPPAAPALQKVRVGGRELEVSPEVAEAIQAREQEFDRRRSEQEQELSHLRQWWQQQAAPSAPPAAVPDGRGQRYDRRIFEAPTQVLDEHGQEIEQRITQRLTQQYLQAQREEQQRATFLGEHPDLKGAQAIVNLVLSEDPSLLTRPDTRDNRAILAERTREKILALSRVIGAQQAGAEATTARRTTVEAGGGGGRRSAPPASQGAPGEGQKPLTLSETIRQRRQARREGQQRLGGGGRAS